MESKWRYPLDKNLQQSEILAEVVTHAITRVELLEGKDSDCVLAEYKEWLTDNIDDEVMVLRQITRNF